MGRGASSNTKGGRKKNWSEGGRKGTTLTTNWDNNMRCRYREYNAEDIDIYCRLIWGDDWKKSKKARRKAEARYELVKILPMLYTGEASGIALRYAEIHPNFTVL